MSPVVTHAIGIPQPESLLLLGVGLIVVAVVVGWARRRRNQDR
ncbi:MAG TPA: hypothetical protein VK736_01570 [Candidatus Binatia bacterium]|nr:hypothetical protein [Candidatus Binatia bacterium]